MSQILSLDELYELAWSIGKECEVLLASSDGQGLAAETSLNQLIKKIMISLDYLEKFALEQDREDKERNDVRVLEMAQRIRMLRENRSKFEEEIEQTEEEWRSENHRLVEENRRLASINTSPSSSSAAAASTSDELLPISDAMQRILERREEEIRNQRQQLVQLESSLKAVNLEAKRSQRELQTQIRTLVNDRAFFITRIQDQTSEIAALKRTLHLSGGVTTKPKSPVGPPTTPKSVDEACASDEACEDAPVQGPMPFEPEDAPWRRRRDSESGIRKL